MTIDKFYNETFEFTLEVIVFDYSKDANTMQALLVKKGMSNNRAYENVTTAKSGGTDFAKSITISFDVGAFKDIKDYKVESIITITHECGHVRGNVLRNIGEKVTTTSSEFSGKIVNAVSLSVYSPSKLFMSVINRVSHPVFVIVKVS